jgi:hypothetical protein
VSDKPRDSTYREEREFVLRFSLEAGFAEDYQGELDGFAWFQEWEQAIKPAIVRAATQIVLQHPGWSCRVRNRGASPEREIELAVERETGEPSK